MPNDDSSSAQDRVRKYRRFNILSLDGGGVRGVIEAIIADRIQENFPKFYRELDLLVGVSTGAIQALGIAADRVPENTKDFFTAGAKYVLADSFLNDFRELWTSTGAYYSGKNMRKALQYQFGDMCLRDLNKKVAILTFDLDDCGTVGRRTWKPKIFHNFPGPASDGDELVVDVAMRSAATPVFFPVHQGYCDGGVIANNPGMVAITQALDSRVQEASLDQINLLSIGSGKAGRYIKGQNLDWGAAQWSSKLLYIMLEGSDRLVDFQCQTLLQERYHRVNPKLPELFSLDAWPQIPKLVEIAENVELAKTMTWLEEYWR